MAMTPEERQRELDAQLARILDIGGIFNGAFRAIGRIGTFAFLLLHVAVSLPLVYWQATLTAGAPPTEMPPEKLPSLFLVLLVSAVVNAVIGGGIMASALGALTDRTSGFAAGMGAAIARAVPLIITNILAALIVVVPLAIVGLVLIGGSGGQGLAVVIAGILLSILSVYLFSFVVAAIPALLEEGKGPIGAIGRSLSLVGGFQAAIMGVFALFLIGFIILTLVASFVFGIISGVAGGEEAVGTAATYGLQPVLNALMLIFMSCLQVAIYLRLRTLKSDAA